MLTYFENVIVILAVGVSVHYLGGLDWPWAILLGAAVSVALRWLFRSVGVARAGKPPLTGGG
jgi:NhaP-type Na+/H+ or K+/H+ antiporter